MKTKRNAYLLWLFSFFGIFGFQQFYLGKTVKGVAYIFTAGFWGIGAIIDLFTLGNQVDKYNNQQSSSNNGRSNVETDSEVKYNDKVENKTSVSSSPKAEPTTSTPTTKVSKQEVAKKTAKKKKTPKVIEELTIGHVEQKGGQVVVFDSNGKRIKNMSLGGGEFKGYGTDFFVISKGKGNATTYNANCKYIKAIAIADYEVIGASGNNFTTKRNNQIRIYDKNGKMISSRNV